MITDSLLRGSIPRLGTITVGRGVEATASNGRTYSQPRKTDGLVFHTNDLEVADAVAATLGGTVHDDSPSWERDVELAADQWVECLVLPFGFRQNLELWRAAECARRCDGDVTSTVDGSPLVAPCVCAREMANGGQRECKPHSVLPVLVDLGVARFGVWEVRSTAWGSARKLKGAVQALVMVGASTGQVPAVLGTEATQVRDQSRKVWDVVDLELRIAADHHHLAELAAASARPELEAGPDVGAGGPDVPPLDQPHEPTADGPADDPEERARAAMMEDWKALAARGDAAGVKQQLHEAWQAHSDADRFSSLTLAELTGWMQTARRIVDEAAPSLSDAPDE